jgi:hypothetical protein
LNTRAAVEELKKLVIELGLPKSDMALFGIRCPYCGKSDRIRQLEPPKELTGALDTESLETYEDLWRQFTPSSRAVLGVCKFCQNPLELFFEKSKAVPLNV